MPDYMQCPYESEVPHPGDYETERIEAYGARRYGYICYWCNAMWPGEYVSEDAESEDAVEEARRLIEGDAELETEDD